MEKRFDVVALGELLIDFAPGGTSASGRPLFECNPGGGPPNVLTAVARQGGSAAFIGKVGEDSFGHMLEQTLTDCGISSEGLCFDHEVRTTLAFVSLDETGNRSFSFFRNPGADFMLDQSQVNPELIQSARIFHHSSLSLTHEPARSATMFALKTAKAAGVPISYDPNLRLPLWPSAEAAREQIVTCLPYADILKISDEEFTFLTGESDFETHAPAFAERYGVTLLYVTLGPKGAYYCYKGHCGVLPTYDVKVVDTTGSGDAFIGAVLTKICAMGGDLQALTETQVREITDFANASGSLTARMKGAIPAIPTAEQVLDCMASVPLLKA